MGGGFELILPSLAGLHPDGIADLIEFNTSVYELMNDKKRGEIDEMLKAAFTPGSTVVAGAILAVRQEGGKKGTSFAIGTPARGPLLKKLAVLKWIRAIWNKKDGDGRGKQNKRTTRC
jgi:hypothetical protein